MVTFLSLGEKGRGNCRDVLYRIYVALFGPLSLRCKSDEKHKYISARKCTLTAMMTLSNYTDCCYLKYLKNQNINLIN